MPQRGIDIDVSLDEVIALAPETVLERLRAHGDVAQGVTDLIDSARGRIMGDLPGALEATAAMVRVADAAGDALQRTAARRARAQALAYGNRFEDALVVLTEAVQLAERCGDDIEAARARMAMVHGLARMGCYDEAIAAGETARLAFEAAGATALAAKANANLGQTYRLRRDPALALECFDRARPALEHDPVAVAQIDSSRAEALLDLNRFGEAEHAFGHALEAFRTANLDRGAAIVEGNLADLMSRCGRIPAALYHFERARRGFQGEAAQGDLARLEAERAEVLTLTGQLREAAAAYEAALRPLQDHGMKAEAARAAVGYGRVLTRLGRLDDADAVLSASEDFRGLMSLGELRLAQTRRAEARTCFTKALEQLGDRPADAATASHALAALEIDEQRLAEADAHLEQAWHTASELDLAPLRADLLFSRSRLRNAQCRLPEAIDDLRDAVAEIERIRGALQAEQFRASFAGDRSDVYAQLITLLLERGGEDDTAEALTTVERAKSRALLDLVTGAVDVLGLDAARAPDPASAALVHDIVEERSRLNALYSRLPDETRTGRAERRRQWRGHVADSERALRQLESRLDATQGIGGLFADPVDIRGIRALLAPTDALVVYYASGDALTAMVVTQDAIAAAPQMASLTNVVQRLERFRLQLGHAIAFGGSSSNVELVDAAKNELGALYDLLFRPVREHVDSAHRLIIVPHGPVHAVPFHALFDGERFLLDAFEIGYAPSASVLRHLAPPVEKGKALVLGVPDEAAPGIEDEVAAVSAVLDDPIVVVGADATIDTLKRFGRDARLIHLACHGRFTPDSPLSSGLKLADGWLTARDLYGLNLRGATIVLSGCDTARTIVEGGDELVGLVRGLLAAGASSLLLSLWPVHDAVSSAMMAETYERWLSAREPRGPRLTAALRQSMLDRAGAGQHPLLWAPFIVVGRD